MNFVKFLRAPFLQNTYGRLLLKQQKHSTQERTSNQRVKSVNNVLNETKIMRPAFAFTKQTTAVKILLLVVLNVEHEC